MPMAAKARMIKVCVECGATFERGYKATDAQWERRSYCSAPCRTNGSRGRKHRPDTIAQRSATRRARTIGNRSVTAHGYVTVMTAEGRRYEHRVVMEQLVGRRLERYEHVHHRNGDTLDNRPENLELLTHSAHSLHHATLRPVDPQASRLKQGQWSRKHDCCVSCGRTERSYAARGMCSLCYFRQVTRPKRAAANS